MTHLKKGEGVTPAERGDEEHMNTKSLKERIDDHLTNIAQELASGTFQGLMTHLKSHARYRSYSPLNRLAILCQRPATGHVMSATAWRELGRTVRDKAQPIFILAPYFGKKEDEDPHSPANALPGAGPNRKPASSTERDTPTYYFTVKVYAVEDTEGPDLTLPGEITHHQVSEEGLQRLIQECPYHLVWDDQPEVRVDERQVYLPSGVATQAGEMLNILHGWAFKDLTDANPKSTHDAEVFHTEATLAAYAVAEVLGLPNREYTLQKLALMWGGKPRRVKHGLARVDKCVARLLNVLAPLEDSLMEHAA